MGAFHINESREAEIREPFKHFKRRYDFVDTDLLSSKYRPNEPDEIERVWVDKSGDKYSKKSKVRGYLVDTLDSEVPPFGPAVEGGRVGSDVILLTVLPLSGHRGQRQIMVHSAYGAGSLVGKIMSNGHILDSLAQHIQPQWPYFQAVFVCGCKFRETAPAEEYYVNRLAEICPVTPI